MTVCLHALGECIPSDRGHIADPGLGFSLAQTASVSREEQAFDSPTQPVLWSPHICPSREGSSPAAWRMFAGWKHAGGTGREEGGRCYTEPLTFLGFSAPAINCAGLHCRRPQLSPHSSLEPEPTPSPTRSLEYIEALFRSVSYHTQNPS